MPPLNKFNCSMVEKWKANQMSVCRTFHNYLVVVHMNLMVRFYCEKNFEIERTNAPTFVD